MLIADPIDLVLFSVTSQLTSVTILWKVCLKIIKLNTVFKTNIVFVTGVVIFIFNLLGRNRLMCFWIYIGRSRFNSRKEKKILKTKSFESMQNTLSFATPRLNLSFQKFIVCTKRPELESNIFISYWSVYLKKGPRQVYYHWEQ